MVPFFYAAFYLSILLFVLLFPLRMFYRAIICFLAWFMWVQPMQEFLVVLNSDSKSREYPTHLGPLLNGRAIFLDYSQRQKWQSFSISTQLFHCFGPQPIPAHFTTLFLPAVIVVRKFKWPKTFTFGERSKREENLAALRCVLVSERSNSI
jgi:hypothetical protein